MDIIEKELSITVKEVENGYVSNVVTGDKDHLYNKLKTSIKKAKKIDIIVSFLMESGVKLILDDLKEAIDRNVPIRILTGNYLEITQPSALYLIKSELQDKVDLRFYNVHKKSFHPKAYIFENDIDSELYVGSSNISRGALTSSIEWNYRIFKSQNEQDFNDFYNTFEDLFYNHSQIIDNEVLKEYSQRWKRPQLYKDLEKYKEEDKIINIFEPRGAQIEALYALDNARNEGYDKGIVVAATGVGKTYLAAFDSKKAKKILFVAHREEILKQAAQSFKNIRPSDESGFFYGTYKDTDKNITFALVQTLGKEIYLNEEYFKKDNFDYIIIDEFHHAVSKNYVNIINYFKPKFLLGLTATPERLDSKDVFALCDYNLVYEIRLTDAINKGYLVPFRYYGIYDETVDYNKIEYKNGKYVEKDLEEALMLNKRCNFILKNYKKYKSSKALGFCTSRKHAEYMAKYFAENNVPSAAVYSNADGEYSKERGEAINDLRSGKIKVIFSVDMFNEGLDIPEVDMVMFLRPTESPSIFLQQLGRGLRKYRGKEYLNVLDFIGNYKKADLIPLILRGAGTKEKTGKAGKEEEYPEDCLVDFDFRLIDLFEEMAKKQTKLKDKIVEEFLRIEEEIGHRPSRVEFFNNIDEGIYQAMKSKSALNVFKDYLGFLKENNRLTEEEEVLLQGRGYDFIKMIENTSMSKSYKIPVILGFYNDGDMKMELSEDDIYKSFYEFYHSGTNKVDMLKDKSTAAFESWGKKEYVSLAVKNPVNFLIKSHGDFFSSSEKEVIKLSKALEEVIKNKEFLEQVFDALEYRKGKYYRERKF
ncbi:Helicase conserved C-terminal domain-containing protein [Clostridium sp. DSM 8431]|uniref:DEAD/DEAH box helicase family protein n=1 Tax=Clostridium sp. DSM 8431 TaxID=1761781 RepID=UPI0008EA7012|nr:DEAD/DEAH box helicase family protein [Clostridium sp. DSM 8431]SFU53619.1 Helicase conserved C-terminal domain-containing protein [Clostridium sp. DSM 8431]